MPPLLQSYQQCIRLYYKSNIERIPLSLLIVIIGLIAFIQQPIIYFQLLGLTGLLILAWVGFKRKHKLKNKRAHKAIPLHYAASKLVLRVFEDV